LSAVAQRAKVEACPPLQFAKDMVGTAQTRLCPPYRFNFQTAQDTASRSRRLFARVLPELLAPSKSRAQGKPGARRTRSLACRIKKAHERSHHRFAETIRPSLRNGFNGYFVLSPVTGLFCHRRHVDRSTKLDASVGASGPHDFAVRLSCVRQRAAKASTASRLNVRDDREAPLGEDGTAHK
jgi:hypothetical protein